MQAKEKMIKIKRIMLNFLEIKLLKLSPLKADVALQNHRGKSLGSVHLLLRWGWQKTEV